MSFDFQQYFINIDSGEEKDSLSGSCVSAAPRLTNRLRKDDLIALLLTIRGGNDIKDAEVKQITQTLLHVFFQTIGSVTRAMTAVGQEINRILMDYNLDAIHDGEHLEGCLNLAVMHKGMLFISHVGPTTTFVLRPEKVDIFQEEDDVKPMGANRNVQVQFYQAEIQPSNILIFNPDPPPTWTHSNLSGSSYLSMEQVRRRLMNQVGGNLQALVIKILPGQGHVLSGEWAKSPVAAQPAQKDAIETQPSPINDLELGEKRPGGNAQVVDETSPVLTEDEILASITKEENSTRDEPEKVFGVSERIGEDLPVHTGETEKSQVENKPSMNVSVETPSEERPQTSKKAEELWLKGKSFYKGINQVFSRIAKKIFPNYSGKTVIPPSFMAFLLILVPLILITASLTVYTRSGKNEQFQSYLDLAQQYQTLATMETDPLQQYTYWSQAFEAISKAEQYGSNTQSANLLQLSQTTMDSMDLTTRLDFRPALTQILPDEINIVDIAVSNSDVYLLDGNSGAILHLGYNSKGYYEVDSSFVCTPGPSGLNTVGKMIDMVVLPPNQPFNYKVMGLDEDGNLLYCVIGDSPSSQKLPAPSSGWKKISAFTLDDGYLYVLDSESDSVWIYEGNEINFTSTPRPFFDEDIPDLSGAIDLAVDKEDLYILNADGHMISCQYSVSKDVKLTTCQDPKPYTDNRLGRQKNPWLFMDSSLISMQATYLPNASLFVLDNSNRAVLQFSFQLNLENTFKIKPSRTYPIPNSNPTAFGVSNSQSLFLAFGNQLYFAPLVQ